MIIEIKNCNNIDNCKISIEENKLNIKYAINGIGKTTIAKAIFSSLDDKKMEHINLMNLSHSNQPMTTQ